MKVMGHHNTKIFVLRFGGIIMWQFVWYGEAASMKADWEFNELLNWNERRIHFRSLKESFQSTVQSEKVFKSCWSMQGV